MKEQFISDLREINKNGIDELIDYLEEINFYKKPASINHHLNYTGGLLEHTVNVKNEYIKLNEEFDTDIPWNNIVIQASIHDLEKCFAYTSEMQHTITPGQNNFLKKLSNKHVDLFNKYNLINYVKNKEFIVSKEFASALIEWFKNGKDIDPPDFDNKWSYNKDNLPLNHSMRAILEASKFIKLEERDILAITYHMGPYSEFSERNRSRAEELYPDVKLLHLADITAINKEDLTSKKE